MARGTVIATVFAALDAQGYFYNQHGNIMINIYKPDGSGASSVSMFDLVRITETEVLGKLEKLDKKAASQFKLKKQMIDSLAKGAIDQAAFDAVFPPTVAGSTTEPDTTEPDTTEPGDNVEATSKK